MGISKQEYEGILNGQRAGHLSILIDVAGWRQLLMGINEERLAVLTGCKVAGTIWSIRILSCLPMPLFFVSAASSVPAFGWWALGVAPVTVVAGALYQGRASTGRQSAVAVSVLLAIAVGLLFFEAVSIWLRVYILVAATAVFACRMLYVITTAFVFRLIYRSYEFVNAFSEDPGGGAFRLIWTTSANAAVRR